MIVKNRPIGTKIIPFSRSTIKRKRMLKKFSWFCWHKQLTIKVILTFKVICILLSKLFSLAFHFSPSDFQIVSKLRKLSTICHRDLVTLALLDPSWIQLYQYWWKEHTWHHSTSAGGCSVFICNFYCDQTWENWVIKTSWAFRIQE